MSIVKLPLSNGGFTSVDLDVAENLKNFSIYRHKPSGYIRVCSGNKQKRLHRFIMNPPAGMVVDHINGDKSDNSYANLRICTPTENQLNVRVQSRSSSGYRLVYRSSNSSTFQLSYRINKKQYYLCSFRSRHIAGIFSDQVLVNLVGPFVKKNFQEKVSSSCLADFLESTNGKIFRVVFSRRSDGRQREMVCRIGVKAHQTGGTLKFNPISRGLFSVYDVRKRAYRFIPLENVICVKFAKTNYRVVA